MSSKPQQSQAEEEPEGSYITLQPCSRAGWGAGIPQNSLEFPAVLPQLPAGISLAWDGPGFPGGQEWAVPGARLGCHWCHHNPTGSTLSSQSLPSRGSGHSQINPSANWARSCSGNWFNIEQGHGQHLLRKPAGNWSNDGTRNYGLISV